MAYEVLYNFISPVTGRILCDPTMVLVGDARGIAIPSTFIPIGALPDLPMGNIWIGNDMNRPIPNPTISINNLPDLPMGNLFIGNEMNRPVVSQTITIDNLPNLSSGKVWIGNGMIPSRPVEGSPPQGPAGPVGPPGAGAAEPSNLANSATDGAVSSLVKFGLEKLFGTGINLVRDLFGTGISLIASFAYDAATTVYGISSIERANQEYVDYRTMNLINGSLVGLRGAAGLAIMPTFFITANISIEGGRIENIAPSPLADYDAVNAKWVWDLLNDNVEIVWAN